MLMGVPAHWVPVLVGVAAIGGLGAMMISGVLGLVVALGVTVGWAGLAVMFARDRVHLPLFLLRLRWRLPHCSSSYTPSYTSVVIEDGR
jgi:hypothetical protein